MVLCKALDEPHHGPGLPLTKVPGQLVVAYRLHHVRDAEELDALEQDLKARNCSCQLSTSLYTPLRTS